MSADISRCTYDNVVNLELPVPSLSDSDDVLMDRRALSDVVVFLMTQSNTQGALIRRSLRRSRPPHVNRSGWRSGREPAEITVNSKATDVSAPRAGFGLHETSLSGDGDRPSIAATDLSTDYGTCPSSRHHQLVMSS